MQKDLAMTKRNHKKQTPVWLRSFNKIEVNLITGCWNWTASKSKLGYAQIRERNKIKEAHIPIYIKYNGLIPDGLELDHLCRNRSCVNPSHLEAVTHAVNMARGKNATKTHCIRGHEFTPKNIRIGSKGSRNCKECEKDRDFF